MEDECVDSVLDADEVNTLTINDRDILQRFVETYKSLPELWDRRCPTYMNKYHKPSALEKLLAVYREMKPAATVQDVSKKLNILRSNYRREQKKINSSLISGVEMNEVYKPTSWLFYSLRFLQDSEGIPANHQNNVTESLKVERTSTTNDSQENPPKKIKSSFHDTSKESVELTHNLTTQYLEKPDSEMDILVKTWAIKFCRLAPDQKRFAEKIINDTLFEAELGTLTTDSVRLISQGYASASYST